MRVRLISRGMRDLLHSKGLERDMERRAEAVADRARSLAPVLSGQYRASLHAETVQHPTRVVGRAVADVPYANQVEAAHRTLGQAIDAARG